MTSNRYSPNNPFNSMKRLFCRVGNKQIYGVYERPPFPIITDAPTVYDIMAEWKLSDFVFAGSMYGTGLVVGFMVGKPFPILR